MKLSNRSQEKELLDLGSDYYSSSEYEDCMRKLFIVNKLLGFYSSTVRTLKKLPPTSKVLDVGCGGGDFILHLSKRFPLMTFTGADISSEAILVANQALSKWNKRQLAKQVTFQHQLVPTLKVDDGAVDVIIATLVCHHLEDEALVDFLKDAVQVANFTVIINDLHRHTLAEWLYRIISPLFRNRLINHDGLISIRRGFKRDEWINLLKQANITNYNIKWCFPFRWKIILNNHQPV